MVFIKELMIFIYETLLVHAPTFFEDLVREDDGSVRIDEIKISYQIPTVIQTDNRVRKEIPLSIDIWYPKAKIYDVMDIVVDIDDEFSDVIWRGNDGQLFKIEKASNYTLDIPDENKNVKRKQVNYNVTLYK